MNRNDVFERLSQLFSETNPDADKQLITKAANCFVRKYGYYDVLPDIALAVATDDELLHLRNAGKKCQQVYANAQIPIRAAYRTLVNDILDLKEAMYSAIPMVQNERLFADVDLMILHCIEVGITSKFKFDLEMPSILAKSAGHGWNVRSDILGNAWIAITKELHSTIKDPRAYIVRYVDDYVENTLVGVDKDEGKKKVVNSLIDAGYRVVVSGKINGLPIHFINAYRNEKGDSKND